MAMNTDEMFGRTGPGALWSGGPVPGQYYSFPGKLTLPGNSSAAQRTLSPVVTGSSVIAVQFDGGVVIAADMLGSYGSLARFRECHRLLKVNDSTVIGAAGDYADFQYLSNIVEQAVIDEECLNDGFGYTPKSMHCWLTRVLYNRRSQFNPLWNTYIVAGLEEGQPFLGYVDKIGMAYEAPALASGFGAYIALPIIRETMDKMTTPMTQAQAVQLIDRCMLLCYYRDARSLNKYQVAIVTAAGVEMKGPISASTSWDIAHLVSGYE